MAFTIVAYNPPYDLDGTQGRRYLHGLLVITATTYAAGGVLPVSYAAIKNQAGAAVLLDTLNVNPDTMWIQSISGSGYTYQYNKASGKIQIFTTGSATQSPQAELAAGAVPAGVISDVIEFEAEWVRV